MDAKRPKKIFVGDLDDQMNAINQQIGILREIRVKGYDYAYQRWSGRWRKIDSLMKKFQNASDKEICEAMNNMARKENHIRKIRWGL